jgi:hypothetical protein
VFHPEGCARRLKRIALIGQRKRQGAQIEEVTPELEASPGFPGLAIFGNQVRLIGAVSRGESFEGTFAIDVLDGDSGPEMIAARVARLIYVRP